MLVKNWTVDYGDERGQISVTVPHAWKQDVSVEWEGPAVYRTRIDVPEEPSQLRFKRVSYYAQVFVDGIFLRDHRGLWTAFSVDLAAFSGRSVDVEVRVTKNGGPTFPVSQVASGFLPFVFQTFGGIHGSVTLRPSNARQAAIEHVQHSISARAGRACVDEQTFYTRGVLTWGWYPETGYPESKNELEEIRFAKGLGFNLLKFCLWVPSHVSLYLLEQEGMFAWLELPVWDPSPDPQAQEQILLELEEIVQQYAHHKNILFWTVGCELSSNVAAEWRRRAYQMVKSYVGDALVRDNSGSAEMYGGDPREFAEYYDYHPYCDTHFYPAVLDSLLTGARDRLPLLLGEFNDCDVHRDLPTLAHNTPYWASNDPRLNAQGVRWQYDLPRMLATNRFARVPPIPEHWELKESSRAKAAFVRKFVQEAVRARGEISGYVLTGWRDTPISTSGILDDWGRPRFEPHEILPWNSETCLFLIPLRRPPWVHGGNRPGWQSLFSHYCGDVMLQLGAHTEKGNTGSLEWSVGDKTGHCSPVTLAPLESRQVGDLFVRMENAGEYVVRCTWGGTSNEWKLRLFERPDFASCCGWGVYDPEDLLRDADLPGGPNLVCTTVPPEFGSAPTVLLMRNEGTVPAPFFRESGYEFFSDPFDLADRWEQFLDIAPDCFLDPAWVAERLPGAEVLMNRIDVRTGVELPVVVQRGNVVATTLRPYGGLGISPWGVKNNPAGAKLLFDLMQIASS